MQESQNHFPLKWINSKMIKQNIMTGALNRYNHKLRNSVKTIEKNKPKNKSNQDMIKLKLKKSIS